MIGVILKWNLYRESSLYVRLLLPELKSKLIWELSDLSSRGISLYTGLIVITSAAVNINY